MVDSFKKVRVDTRRPNVRLESATPNVLSPVPGGARRVRVAYSGPRNVAPEFRVFRTDVNPPKVVRLFRGDRSRSGVWDGTVRGGGFAPDGSYSFFVLVRDLAGNLTRAPAPDPPRASTSRAPNRGRRAPSHSGRPGGARVRRVDRDVPGRAGRAPVRVRAVAARVGAQHPPRPAPRRAPAGADTARRAHRRVSGARPRRRAARGVAGGRGRSARHRPAQPTAPARWWCCRRSPGRGSTGGTRISTASRTRSRARARSPPTGPTPAAAPPPRFAAEASPLLRFLDREHLAYDITTDVALARGRGAGDRATRRAWRSPARLAGCPAGCATACATRSRHAGCELPRSGSTR